MARALGVLVKKKLNLDNNWDPTKPDNEETVTSNTNHRITVDIVECVNADSHHNIVVVPDSDNVLHAHAIIIGPEETPYEGGFFYFFIKFPANYPILPPRVKLMNTEQNSIRFNPNIYANGMVCLSILDTFSGEGWSPLNTLFSVLISIQALMNADPFYNSPGLTGYKENEEDTPNKYIHYIRHETIRVAVVNFMIEGNLDLRQMPITIRDNINKIFRRKITFYFKTITDNMFLDGTEMLDPFNYNTKGQRFNYGALKEQMGELTKKYHSNPDVVRSNFNLFNAIGEHDDLQGLQEKLECSDLSDPDSNSDSN